MRALDLPLLAVLLEGHPHPAAGRRHGGDLGAFEELETVGQEPVAQDLDQLGVVLGH